MGKSRQCDTLYTSHIYCGRSSVVNVYIYRSINLYNLVWNRKRNKEIINRRFVSAEAFSEFSFTLPFYLRWAHYFKSLVLTKRYAMLSFNIYCLFIWNKIMILSAKFKDMCEHWTLNSFNTLTSEIEALLPHWSMNHSNIICGFFFIGRPSRMKHINFNKL